MIESKSKTIRVIIVDDEPLAVERMQHLCDAIPNLEVVATASDGEQVADLVDSTSPDLILLDIGMPQMDGISTARALSGKLNKPAVIFVTAYDNFAVEAFDLDVVDYLLKPVSAERLSRAIARAAEHIQDTTTQSVPETSLPKGGYADEFWVSHRSDLIRVTTNEILRVEAERDYMRLHTPQRSYLLHQTISTLEQRLDPERFLRIHRSHIIRRDLITGLRHEGGGVWHAILGPDHSMRIGRKFLAEVKRLAGK
jgi:DNA-binding LytR/AlgR family response regulator